MDQVVDIATEGRHLSRDRGFLKVSEEGTEVGRIPLDQIVAVIVHAQGTTWSTSLLTELGERNAPVVLCGVNHSPRSVLLPIEGHYAQGARIRSQWEAKAPLMKQAWKKIVIAKVKMQAQVLSAVDQPCARLDQLARMVTSGDSTNIEAQAARYYWPLLMGCTFRRNSVGDGANALLNYGYTVLRAATARAVVAAGLHPSIGLHHSNRGNAFALADDLVEPFRPLVDCIVWNLVRKSGEVVDKAAKQALAQVIAVDLPLDSGTTPVSLALVKLATSVGRSFESSRLSLALPDPPVPLSLRGLGA